jgi:hypothetical protein
MKATIKCWPSSAVAADCVATTISLLAIKTINQSKNDEGEEVI